MKLDLKQIKKETLDITLADGSLLKVKKPNTRLVIEISKLDTNKLNAANVEEVLEIAEEITCKILSNNTEGIKFTKEKIEELGMDYDIQTIIFDSYVKFTTQVSA